MPALQDAANYVGKVVGKNGKILFVGTKRAARNPIKEAADSCGMPYVNRRWSGGLMTNFKTVKQSVRRLLELEAMASDGTLDARSKKEALGLQRELDKLEKGMGGIKHMERLPDALFVVDVGHERIAISEANKLGIPVIAVVDSNNTPNGVDYVIPGNDDAIRAIQLYADAMAGAVRDARVAAGGIEAYEQPTEAAAAPAAAPATDAPAPTAEETAPAATPEASAPAADAAAAPATDSSAAPATAADSGDTPNA